MNTIPAKIINIKKENNVAFVKLQDKYKNIFSVLMLDFDKQNIDIGLECNIIFKESEVMVAHTQSVNLSARNKFEGKVLNIEEDSIFARISFDFYGMTINSLITQEAKKELNINIGDSFIWFIKSNELMLQY
ncbi:molybdopterin-binding protein [Helicobacter sp. MIT 99-5507]|uniref:TOBE domain-containing protein n=1 Tax=Helicobacter sp. MIT 99-5507 TaxID=152489 RepID=UPI0015F15A73|nr:TOBE domain-containing protein [Helicobacter sp. MIT 99-5507]